MFDYKIQINYEIKINYKACENICNCNSITTKVQLKYLTYMFCLQNLMSQTI
jgi:hypothetical protein